MNPWCTLPCHISQWSVNIVDCTTLKTANMAKFWHKKFKIWGFLYPFPRWLIKAKCSIREKTDNEQTKTSNFFVHWRRAKSQPPVYRSCRKKYGHTHTRCRKQDTENVVGDGEWVGYPLPSRLGDIGERRKLPQRGTGRSLGRSGIL